MQLIHYGLDRFSVPDFFNPTFIEVRYCAWMNVKAVFTGHDRKSDLENCEFGEDAAQKAYKNAANDSNLLAYLRDLVKKRTLRQS